MQAARVVEMLVSSSFPLFADDDERRSSGERSAEALTIAMVKEDNKYWTLTLLSEMTLNA